MKNCLLAIYNYSTCKLITSQFIIIQHVLLKGAKIRLQLTKKKTQRIDIDPILL